MPFPLEQAFTLTGLPLLDSLPGSLRTIHLDFDGHTATGTAWGDEVSAAPFDLDGDPAVFTADEAAAIRAIWQEVAEDFSPFDVNVTTQEPPTELITRSGTADDTYGTRVAVGPRTPAFEGSTVGLSYVGVFDEPRNHERYQPAWVDPTTLTSLSQIALTITHETGHALGLNHLSSPPPTSLWQPIMWPSTGNGALSQWAIGTGDTGLQDAIAIMAANGVVARTDDHSDGSVGATSLGGPTDLAGSGVISTRNDVDVFTVDAVPGMLSLQVLPAPVGPNLDIKAELYDASGQLLQPSDPSTGSVPEGLAASITYPVSSGTYYLFVDGVGDEQGGWDDYGSLGQYTIAGSIAPALDIVDLDLSTASISEGGSVTVSGRYEGGEGVPSAEAIWSDGAASVVMVDGPAATFTTTRTFPDDEPSGTSADQLTVDITLSDGNGSKTATSPTVTVHNVEPTITGWSADEAVIAIGTPVTVRGSFSDPADGVATERFEYLASWNDGSTSAVVRDGATGELSTSRTFAEGDLPVGATEADFEVTLTVTDDDLGQALSQPVTVTVINADLDGDGVLNEADRCPGTILPEAAASPQQPHRYTVIEGWFVSSDGTVGPSLQEAGGCAAAQITEALGIGAGHEKFGVSEGVLQRWIKGVGRSAR